jgi:hypothetical protein
VVWLLHQTFLVASETLSGLMVYWSWAEASDSKAADARAVAVNVFIMPDYGRCCMQVVMFVNARLISRNVSVCPIVEARCCVQWLLGWHANGAVGRVHS